MDTHKPKEEASWKALHDAMVRRLLAHGDLRTGHVEAAFRKVPRHLFLPGVPVEVVYAGEAVITHRRSDGLPISSSSMPSIMAIMLEQLAVEQGHHVLEIGAGTGYNAALLAALAGPQGRVTTIDLDEEIIHEARTHLETAGYQVHAITGDGWLGVPEYAPYDRIEATVGVWDLSTFWVDQLRDGGLVIAPLWLAPGAQVSVAFRKDGGRLASTTVKRCGFMRLRGPHAAPEATVNVEGWTVSLGEPNPDRVAALSELLRTAPRVEPAPVLPDGWQARAALEEPLAVALQANGNWRDIGYGVLEATQRSLAFIRGKDLYTYGDNAARTTLLVRLAGTRPLDLRKVAIEAVPSNVAKPPSGSIVLHRPNFKFVIREDA